MTFTDLLDDYLWLKHKIDVEHEPVYDEYKAAKRDLDTYIAQIKELSNANANAGPNTK